MSNADVKAAVVEKAKEYGPSGSSPSDSQKTKVDVTISGAPDAAKGANGDYSLHTTPLSGQTIPYYQGIDGDLFHMFIIYSEKERQWLITSDKSTPSETKIGVVAYIVCKPEDAKINYLASVSGIKEWFIKSSESSKPDYKAPYMVADVKSGGESPAAEAAPESSTAASTAASPVAASSKIAEPPPDLETMKTICASVVEAHDDITNQFKAIVYSNQDSVSSFEKKLEQTISALKEAKESLETYKKNPSDIKDNIYDGGKGSGSSSSKKNRKSYKSYHPGIGKTRKHHSHSEPKRISFVHPA